MKLFNIKELLALIFCTSLLSACGIDSDEKPLLMLNVDAPEDTEIHIAYSPYYDFIETSYLKVELDSLGNFEFNPAFPEGITSCDIDVYIAKDNLGVHLEKGKTSQMNIKVDNNGDSFVEFNGDNTDLNRMVCAMAKSFDTMKYNSNDKSPEEYEVILDREYASLKPYIPEIKDEYNQDYYRRLADCRYKWQKTALLSRRSYIDGRDVSEYPEYVDIIESIDPDDEIAGRSNLLEIWIPYHSKIKIDWEKPEFDAFISELNLIDSLITNPTNRHRALNMTADSFYSYTKPSAEDAEKYLDYFRNCAANYSDLIDKYKIKTEKIKNSACAGQELPYTPILQCTDNKEISLSDLYGKVIYMDIWATWCKPCRREIPNFAKLVKQFKDNDKILFISVSVDENEDAWKEFLKNEKSDWPQYRLTPEQNKRFSDALRIETIPRFILIGSDGRLIDPDAPRPGNPEILTMLQPLL